MTASYIKKRGVLVVLRLSKGDQGVFWHAGWDDKKYDPFINNIKEKETPND